MDTPVTPRQPDRTREEIRAEINRLNELRRAETDPSIREDLGDAISSLAMGAQFREIEDD